MGPTHRRGETADEAVLRLVQEHAAELLRFARRFSMCADDAHDAYQRAIEILVCRMRKDPPQNPLSWLRTVLRNECVKVRMQREELVGRSEVDLDRHEAKELEDPADRVAGFERIERVAEALQRLKPQEVTALVLRAEGLSYEEICARQHWSYTKTNRCVTEGRRALLDRLGAIESGAECARWLPELSALADGEASARQVAELRPHLRACPACRATLRRFHGAPRQVAALVPVALVPLSADPGGAVARHVETVLHVVLERATLVAMRVQGALDAVPSAKVAAVAASTAAIAGGGVAIEHTATQAHEPAARVARASGAAASPAAVTAPQAVVPSRSSASAPARRRSSAAGSEFALEADSGPQVATPPAPSPTVARAASATAQTPPPRTTPVAEFAGP